MRTATDVSTDDLVNSLLNSVTSTSSDATDSTSTSSVSASSSSASPSETSSSSASPSETSSSSSSSASSAATVAPKTTSPATTSPRTTKSPTSSTSGSASSETATRGAASSSSSSSSSEDDGSGGGAALSIGIAIGVLALVVAVLLFLRSRRRRAQKERESAASPPTGATCLTVPADRGFKQERELGLPEMSIELPPGHLGFSKGLDMSYASSSARSSAASNNFSSSVASSTDSSVFNTQGGVSPTFDSRKMASYSYQYRASSDGENAVANSSQHSNGSTTFHLTGLIGNGNTASNRGANADGSRGRKLSAPDEYAELVTATNAHGQMDMDAHSSKNQPQELHADFTTSHNGCSMGPDADNHSFLAPLPTRAPPMAVREPSVVRASEESMGPDSPVAGRSKRTGSVYDTLPKLSGEKMTASFVRPSEDEDPRGVSVASFLSESSISSTSTRDSAATSARGSAYVASMPLLQQLSSAEDSDYGEDHSSERASTDSTDSANMTRSGSLIAMNLDAKDGCSEIAI